MVVAGQGTIGLEILDDIPAVDTVVVAIGGGGLSAGVALAVKALKPDVRVLLKTDDDALILLTYRGVRHGPDAVMARIAAGEAVAPEEYYLRTVLQFETASETYDWLNRILAVGVGRREPNGVTYDVFEIL